MISQDIKEFNIKEFIFSLRKNKGDPKVAKWEDYVDTMTEVNSEDGVSNPVHDGEGCFLG